MIAIDTGYHVDNMGGNQALLEADIPVYGSDLTAKLILERGEQNRQSMLAAIGDPQSPAYQAEMAMKYLPPDHIFPIAQGLTLVFGGENVQVIYPGPSQAPDKVAVYFPEREIAFWKLHDHRHGYVGQYCGCRYEKLAGGSAETATISGGCGCSRSRRPAGSRVNPTHARSGDDDPIMIRWSVEIYLSTSECLPSQKGLFVDFPHRQSVTRLRIS